MSKKYVKYDDKYFLIEIDCADGEQRRNNGSNGFRLRPITEEEILSLEAEKVFLKDNEFKDTANILQEAIDEASNELKEAFKKNVKDTVLNALGFSKSWGKWEVDHCNGRMSEVGKLIVDEVKQFILEDQLRVRKENLITLEERAELIVATKKDFQSVFCRELERGLYEEANHRAKEKAKELVDEIMRSRLESSVAEFAEKAFESKKT